MAGPLDGIRISDPSRMASFANSRTRRRRLIPLVSLFGVAALLALGCGDDSDDTSGDGAADTDGSETDTPETGALATGTMTVVVELTEESVATPAVGFVERRLATAGFMADQREVTSEGTTVTAVVTGVTSEDFDAFSVGMPGAGGLEARPVLSLLPPDHELDPSDPDTLADANGTVYALGPATSLAGEVRADIAFLTEQPAIIVEFTTPGLEAFNELASQCFEKTTECPSGQLALIADGGVLSAPAVNAPTFDGEINISGVFTTNEAAVLADAINGIVAFDIEEETTAYEPG